ncbi:hypothetical protein F2Q70_00012317 [Brassica cretica]|uniref:Uncharacterized protein n=1 Tax=Brassica cretica TaxID=69181 RepID=A0A8S9M735_BRACR|nr:hypothetical protein F2Q70_00012317 [Brassica cretica]
MTVYAWFATPSRSTSEFLEVMRLRRSYSLREIASKGRRECMDKCRIDVSEELGRYVAT